MPSTSEKQAKFMRAVAHSPKFAKKVGVAQSVGKDFEMADKKKSKFGRGGVTVQLPPSAAEKAAKEKAARAKAAKDKAEDARYRKYMGSDEDIVARGNRSQSLEAGEERALGNAKGGKIMKKGKFGAGMAKAMKATVAGKAMKKTSADAKGRALPKFAKGGNVKRYDDGGAAGASASAPRGGLRNMADRMAFMRGKFDDKMARFRDRMADMPAARRAQMQERVDAMGDRFGAKMDRMEAPAPAPAVSAPAPAASAPATPVAAANRPAAPGRPAMKKGGATKKCYAKGGGVERKGKTKGTMIKMAKGGSVDGCAIRGKTRAPMKKGK